MRYWTDEERTALYRRRMPVVEKAADDGLKLRSAAKLLGITGPGLHRYLTRNNRADLLDRLNDNWKSNMTPRTEVVHRLRVIAASKTYSEAAIILGMSRAGMSQWVKKYCPDGAATALEDYEDEDEGPELCLF